MTGNRAAHSVMFCSHATLALSRADLLTVPSVVAVSLLSKPYWCQLVVTHRERMLTVLVAAGGSSREVTAES